MLFKNRYILMLLGYIQHLYEQLKTLRKRIFELEGEVCKLQEQVKDLETDISRSKVIKDSSNSSLPPSQDMKRCSKNRSLREKSGRSSGGQSGHKGHTLHYSHEPDEIVDHRPSYCGKCGSSLSGLSASLVSKRQVVELPPVVPKYIEHRQYSIDCPCGHCQQSDFPDGVNAPIQYGAGIVALVCYLNVRQMLPYKRLSETLWHMVGLKISEGSIANMLRKTSDKGESIYNFIKEKISTDIVIGADETSFKVGAKKHWIWIWQTKSYTFISPQATRSSTVAQNLFPEGFKNACLISDRYPAHLSTPALTHQLCLVHLQRDVQYLYDLEQTQWATDFAGWLKEAIALKKNQTTAYHKQDKAAINIEEQLILLLNTTIDKQQSPKTATFCKAMNKNRERLTVFLYNSHVPFHNNASECGIRNIKVKQKISGQFKTGQECYAILRSIIDTTIKQGRNIWEVLTALTLVTTPNIATYPQPE